MELEKFIVEGPVLDYPALVLQPYCSNQTNISSQMPFFSITICGRTSSHFRERYQ